MAGSEFRTINELFLKAVERHAKPDAFFCKSGGQYRGISSQQALETVAALARELDRRGIRRGDQGFHAARESPARLDAPPEIRW